MLLVRLNGALFYLRVMTMSVPSFNTRPGCVARASRSRLDRVGDSGSIGLPARCDDGDMLAAERGGEDGWGVYGLPLLLRVCDEAV